MQDQHENTLMVVLFESILFGSIEKPHILSKYLEKQKAFD